MKTAGLVLALFLTVLASAAFSAERVRILDYDNGPAARLLFLEIDRALGERFPLRTAWHSLDRPSGEGEPEAIALEAASGAFDLVITRDEGFARYLEERGALLERRPLFESELILVGPGREGERFAGRGAPEVMWELFGRGRLFFTLMGDAWMEEQEARLWREVEVPAPGGNTNYVESGRDGLTLLLQAEDEGGYTLTTEDTFAQYLTVTRAPEPLARIAEAGARRAYFLCRIDHQGFREERTRDAAAMASWLAGEESAARIDAFELGGLRPFKNAASLEK